MSEAPEGIVQQIMHADWVQSLTTFNTIVCIALIALMTYVIIRVNQVCKRVDTVALDIRATIGRLIKELNAVHKTHSTVDQSQSDEIRTLKRNVPISI
jgi:energy-converting hydrogenase Eha subunit H